MKNTVLFFFFLTAAYPLFSHLDVVEPPPFALESSFVCIKPTTLDKQEDLGKLGYQTFEARFNYLHPLSACDGPSSEGLIFGAGVDSTQLHWSKNPFFTETHFSYVNLALGGYTTYFTDFVWSLSLAAYLDTQVLDLSDYAFYETVLLGKYSLTPYLLFEAGFIANWGLSNNQIWPILGFEWDQGGPIRIGAVFPIDLIIEYRLIADVLSTAIGARFFQSRHRVKDSLPLPRQLFEYRNWGIEGSIICFPARCPASNLVVIGFAGTTLNGKLKIADDKNHSPHYFKTHHALYGGIEGNWTF